MIAIAIGVASNGLAVLVNGGWMPVWVPSLEAVGLSTADLNTAFHTPLPETFGLEFFLRAGPIGDVIPLPLGPLSNVASVGDGLIALGIGWFLFSSLARRRGDAGEGGVALGPGGLAFADLDRPVVLGGPRGPAGAEALIELRPRRRHP